MFCDHPERFFPFARIEVVDIPDPTGQGMVEKTFTGPIQRQLRDALQHLQNYEIKRMTTKEADRAEATVVSNYPYAAAEGILSNAVYHRSYQICEPITVTVTPEQMEVTSFPDFGRTSTDEAIARYDIRARMYRNRRRGGYLKELHLIEGPNTGFPTAFRALKANGSGLPRFEMDENRATSRWWFQCIPPLSHQARNGARTTQSGC